MMLAMYCADWLHLFGGAECNCPVIVFPPRNRYWSPAPAWKHTHSYYTGTLSSFNASFLDAFCTSVLGDVKYLEAAGLTVVGWGLQNEPNFDTTYGNFDIILDHL